MNALHLTIALGPVAVYGLALGLIHASRRPLLTGGTREIYAIGVAVSGFVVVGPVSLFMPTALSQRLGISVLDSLVVWAFIAVSYLLFLAMVSLLARPRLVAYNVSLAALRSTFDSLLTRTQWKHQWSGNCLILPELGVQFQIERSASPNCVSLVATTRYQSPNSWRLLESELAGELSQLPEEKRSGNTLYLYLSMVILMLVVGRLMFANPHDIVAALAEIWRP